MPLSRREFLSSSAAGFAGLSAASFGRPDCSAAQEAAQSAVLAPQAPRGGNADATPFPIVDTHTHFYDPSRPQGVPWPSKNDALLYRPVLPKEFESLTKPFGVTGTVIVEASSWLEDNQWLLDLAQNDPFVLGIVGNLTPGTDAFVGQLARFAKNPVFRGIRVNSDLVKQGLDRPEYVADLKRLIDADLELDVNAGPPMLPVVDQLAAKLPDLRIVVNHLSNVRIDGKEPPETWREGLKAAAKHPKVFLKVSGYVDNARGDKPKSPEEFAYYRPTLQAAWDAFGEDRLIYGSNWPVSDNAGPYRLIIQIASEFIRDKGTEATKKFFAGNAQAAYRWPVRK